MMMNSEFIWETLPKTKVERVYRKILKINLGHHTHVHHVISTPHTHANAHK